MKTIRIGEVRWVSATFPSPKDMRHFTRRKKGVGSPQTTMKTISILGLVCSAVAVGVFAVGCEPETANSQPAPTPPPPAEQPVVPVAAPAPPLPTEVKQGEKADSPSPVMQKIDPAISANLPASVREVVGLVQAGVDEAVIKAFIEKSSGATYDLSADQIIYLNDIGIPSGLVAAMLEQGAKVRAETAKATAASAAAKAAMAQAAAAAAAAAEPPAVAPAPVADPVVPAPAEPSVVYTVPTYVTGTATTFYAPLSPYGTWINHADFGWCWQPQ